jgi:2-polyprenyl-6-methoxyphenol hydroxylase-like FAD-dependent oxidoreductase
MEKKIAIIGGGIAGLTFSLCLENENYHCYIFEKKSDIHEVGAGISVFPNALKVLRSIGLLEDILSASGTMKNMHLRTSSGKYLLSTVSQYDMPTVCMHRADLHNILLKHSRAEINSGYEVEQINEKEDGKIELIFTNGSTFDADLVIGADGLHSVVRKHLIGDGAPIYRGYNCWRGVVKSNFESGYGSETYGLGKRVGIVPIKDGYYAWWATVNEDQTEKDEPEGVKNKLKRHFGNWHHPIPEFMEATENILKNSISDRPITKGWHKGKVVLLGDAAHPTTPNLGQGGCMAMEGAFLLARSIDKYGISNDAFERYETLPKSKKDS